MPTTRPRHPITETDDIAAVLDEAARVWPGTPRRELIIRIMRDWAFGGRSPAERARARRELVGTLPGSSALYRPGDDWPE